MLVSVPPNLSVSGAVQRLKGRSSHKLLSEFGYCANATRASICGRGVIGLPQAAILPTKCGEPDAARA
nr:transposase [Mesorhizobium sp. WSM3864]